MKASIALSLILFASQMASAATHCIVNTSTTSDMTYDQLVFEYDLGESKNFILSADRKSSQEMVFENFEQWTKYNGQTVVSFVRQENGDVGIVFAKIDISKSENILPITAMANGPVTSNRFLHLMAPQENLSALCLER